VGVLSKRIHWESDDYSILGSCGAFIRSGASHWSGGGHVLDLTSEDATLAIDHSPGLHVELPETPAFLAAGLGKAGTSEAVKEAEG
jgi:alpha-acetolactate decarboxylase